MPLHSHCAVAAAKNGTAQLEPLSLVRTPPSLVRTPRQLLGNQKMRLAVRSLSWKGKVQPHRALVLSAGVVVNAFNSSQRLTGCTNQVPNQPGPHSETLTQKFWSWVVVMISQHDEWMFLDD